MESGSFQDLTVVLLTCMVSSSTDQINSSPHMGDAASGSRRMRDLPFVHLEAEGTREHPRAEALLGRLSGVPRRLLPIENFGDCFPVSQDSAFGLISLLKSE